MGVEATLVKIYEDEGMIRCGIEVKPVKGEQRRPHLQSKAILPSAIFLSAFTSWTRHLKLRRE